MKISQAFSNFDTRSILDEHDDVHQENFYLSDGFCDDLEQQLEKLQKITQKRMINGVEKWNSKN